MVHQTPSRKSLLFFQNLAFFILSKFLFPRAISDITFFFIGIAQLFENRWKNNGRTLFLRRSLVKLGLFEVGSNAIGRVAVGVCAVFRGLCFEAFNLLLGLVNVLETKKNVSIAQKWLFGWDPPYLLGLAGLVLLPALELGLDLLNDTGDSGLG